MINAVPHGHLHMGQGDDKSLAILVRMWDSQRKPVTRFSDMPVCNIATAEKLF